MRVKSIQPQGEWLAVRPLQIGEFTPSGLYIPPRSRELVFENLLIAQIVAVGEGLPVDDWKGGEQPRFGGPRYQVGQWVQYIDVCNLFIKVAGERLLMLREGDVQAVVEVEEDTVEDRRENFADKLSVETAGIRP